jgi:hypothetical protein
MDKLIVVVTLRPPRIMGHIIRYLQSYVTRFPNMKVNMGLIQLLSFVEHQILSEDPYLELSSQ